MTSPLGCWWAAHVGRIQNQTPDLPLRPGRPPTSGIGGSNLGAQAKNCGISPRLPTSDTSQNLQNTRGLTFLTWPAGPLPSFTGLPRPQASRAHPQHPLSAPSPPAPAPTLCSPPPPVEATCVPSQFHTLQGVTHRERRWHACHMLMGLSAGTHPSR